jgi:predicted TIM-barrel fold metal-dependent hydrolase
VASVIDVHTHLHPPRLFTAIRRWFDERSPWQLRHPTEPAEVAAFLYGQGVERFAFCSYAHKPGMAADLNGWLADTGRALGPRAVPLATVHVEDPDPTGDARAALAAGCGGLKVHEDVQRFGLDDPRLFGTLQAVAEHEGFVLAHVGHIPWSGETNDGPARIARVLEQHPTLNVVVAHFGMPDYVRYLDLMPQHPRLFLDTTMVFAPDSPMFGNVPRGEVERGAAQIVLGTDYPNIPQAWGSELAGLQALGLDDTMLHAITSENAKRLTPRFAG